MNKLSTRAYRSKPVRSTVLLSDNITQSTGNIRIHEKQSRGGDFGWTPMKFFPHLVKR